MRAVPALLVLFTSAAGCTAYRPPDDSAGLRLLVEPAPSNAATAIHVTILNEGNRPLAVSMTFGYHVFLDLRVRQDGREIPFPVEADFFDYIPRWHECLRPKEVRSMVFDLENLRILHGGKTTDHRPFGFKLDRTKPIEVQATYRNGLHNARCELPASTVESPWLLLPALDPTAADR